MYQCYLLTYFLSKEVTSDLRYKTCLPSASLLSSLFFWGEVLTSLSRPTPWRLGSGCRKAVYECLEYVCADGHPTLSKIWLQGSWICDVCRHKESTQATQETSPQPHDRPEGLQGLLVQAGVFFGREILQETSREQTAILHDVHPFKGRHHESTISESTLPVTAVGRTFCHGCGVQW